MKTLKAVAVDIDGVLVTDTFSPVIKLLVERHGSTYDREVERNVFSQNRHVAASYLLHRLRLDMSPDDFLALYFRTRDEWIAAHGGGLNPGVEGFLDVLKQTGLRTICYGGLSQSYFEKELGPWAGRFERYVCTNDFRPGVAEIVRDTFQMEPRQVLFVDDVSRVAEEAKRLGCPFIGMPAPFEWSHQRRDMQTVGVPFLAGALQDFTADLLGRCDDRASRGFWGE